MGLVYSYLYPMGNPDDFDESVGKEGDFDNSANSDNFGETLVADHLKGTVAAIELYVQMLEKKVEKLVIIYNWKPSSMVLQSSTFYGVGTSIVKAYDQLFDARCKTEAHRGMKRAIQLIGPERIPDFLTVINMILSHPRRTPQFDLLKELLEEQKRAIRVLKEIPDFADKEST
uniref:Exocyst complex component Sec8 n=2 Tax=Caenorhabditis tropicalis TaxID=1561998 RepID=A0A1I7UQD7_9PELO